MARIEYGENVMIPLLIIPKKKAVIGGTVTYIDRTATTTNPVVSTGTYVVVNGTYGYPGRMGDGDISSTGSVSTTSTSIGDIFAHVFNTRKTVKSINFCTSYGTGYQCLTATAMYLDGGTWKEISGLVGIDVSATTYGTSKWIVERQIDISCDGIGWRMDTAAGGRPFFSEIDASFI